MLNGVSHEVVGVMPEGFAYPEQAELLDSTCTLGTVRGNDAIAHRILADDHRPLARGRRARHRAIGHGWDRRAARTPVSGK